MKRIISRIVYSLSKIDKSKLQFARMILSLALFALGIQLGVEEPGGTGG